MLKSDIRGEEPSVCDREIKIDLRNELKNETEHTIHMS